MAYNVTQFVNASQTLPSFLTNLNIASNGFFILGALFTIFVIIFMAMSFYDKRVSLLTSSMITTLLTILSWGAGWIAFSYIFIPAIFLFASLVWSALGEK